MRLKNWIQAPTEWEDWGTRFDAWMNVLAEAVRNHRWVSADGTATTYREQAASGRIQSYVQNDTAGSPNHEYYYNGVRTSIESASVWTHYEDDGGTAMLSMLRTNGRMLTYYTENAALNPYAGWTDYGAPYEGWRAYKDFNGFVHLRGLVRNTSGATKAAGSNMILMPAGWRPASTEIHTVITNAGVARLDIPSTGNLSLASVAIPNNGWVSVSGVSFYAGN